MSCDTHLTTKVDRVLEEEASTVPVPVSVDGKQMQRALKKADTGSFWVDVVIACWQPSDTGFAAVSVNHIC